MCASEEIGSSTGEGPFRSHTLQQLYEIGITNTHIKLFDVEKHIKEVEDLI